MDKDKENLHLELRKYKKAYNVLMDYWGSLPDEEKILIDQRLNKIFDKN